MDAPPVLPALREGHGPEEEGRDPKHRTQSFDPITAPRDWRPPLRDLVELQEEVAYAWRQAWKQRRFRQGLACAEARIAGTCGDQHLPGIWEDQPDDLNPGVEVPARLRAQRALPLVESGYLDCKHGWNRDEVAPRWPHVSKAPDRRVRSADVVAKLHSRFIGTNDEFSKWTSPHPEQYREVDADALLHIPTGRDVEEPPVDVLETAIGARPG